MNVNNINVLKNWSHWFIYDNKIVSSTLVINAVGQIFDSIKPVTLILNVPLRAIHFTQEIAHRNYFRATLEVAALTALFFPYGPLIASSIDIGGILFDWERTQSFIKLSLLDPSDTGNAYRILGLTPHTEIDNTTLEALYQSRKQDLTFRKERGSKPIAEALQRVIDNLTAAFNHLKNNRS